MDASYEMATAETREITVERTTADAPSGQRFTPVKRRRVAVQPSFSKPVTSNRLFWIAAPVETATNSSQEAVKLPGCLRDLRVTTSRRNQLWATTRAPRGRSRATLPSSFSWAPANRREFPANEVPVESAGQGIERIGAPADKAGGTGHPRSCGWHAAGTRWVYCLFRPSPSLRYER